MFFLYENINKFNIDIDTRLHIQDEIIECDKIQTKMYKTQNWSHLNYIVNSCILIIDKIPKENYLDLQNSNIWSLYSNYCSKMNKLYNIFEKM